MLEKEITALANLLSQPRKILLLSHINPDGDAIGSTMGMYHFLQKTGHEVTAMVPNVFPEFLAWLEGSNEIIAFQDNQKKGRKAIAEAEVIICLDFNDYKRLKEMGKLLETSKATKVLIDHHPDPDNAYQIKIHDTTVSSTSELVYHFIVGSGNRPILNSTIASPIYCGIMTDTGCFNFNSSKPETFEVVADLLRCGIDKDAIFDNVFNNFSHQRMRLMGYCLHKKMIVLPHFHAAYISLTKEEMERYNFQPGDSEGFVNLPFSIKGINIAALFTEKKDIIRVSMRSRGNFAINQICQEHFNGGGHKNASGGEVHISLKKAIKKFEKILKLNESQIISTYTNI